MTGGGTRMRLIRDSFHHMVNTSLEDLGWFDTGRSHNTVQLVTSPIDPSQELTPNIIGVSPEDMSSMEDELGSNLEELRWDFYVDIFAESDVLGLHLMGDLRDTLKGKLPSIGRTGPSFQVYDFRTTTPSELFVCQLENIQVERQREWSKPWMKYWWTILVEVVDHYYDEST